MTCRNGIMHRRGIQNMVHHHIPLRILDSLAATREAPGPTRGVLSTSIALRHEHAPIEFTPLTLVAETEIVSKTPESNLPCRSLVIGVMRSWGLSAKTVHPLGAPRSA